MKKKVFISACSALLLVTACVACNSKPSEEESAISDTAIEAEENTDNAGDADMEEPAVSGGWDIKEYDELYIPGSAKEALDLAMESYTGLSIKPIVVLATQVVAGTNYKFLATTSATASKAENKLSLVTVYKDLEGNASITDVQDIDIANAMNSGNASENEGDSEDVTIAGGWHTGDEYDTVAADEGNSLAFWAVGEAATKGHELICTLGTQVVAGTNYALLCRVTDDDGTCYYDIDFVYVPASESEDPELLCEYYIDPANTEN